MMSNERSSRGVPNSLRCCTCDGKEGPCAVPKVVLFPVQEQDAAFEPAFVLQGQPLHQQRGALGQRHAACGRRGEVRGERHRGKGGRQREKVHTRNQTGSVSKCRKRAYNAVNRHPVSQKPQSKSKTKPSTA